MSIAPNEYHMLVCSHQCLPGGGGGALLRMGIARARVCYQLHDPVLVTRCGLDIYVHRQLGPSRNIAKSTSPPVLVLNTVVAHCHRRSEDEHDPER